MATETKNQFLSTILEVKAIRGEEAEKKVKMALEQIKNEGVIQNFGQTTKFGIEDWAGIDFMVFKHSGKEILLQVKGYPLNQKEQKRYQKKGIYVVFAFPDKKIEVIKKEILDIIKRKNHRSR